MSALQIEHDAAQGRFRAEIEGHACVLDYQHAPGRLVITHTGTPPALRGRGLAGQLVEHALDWLAPQAVQLVPACSYVQVHLQRHPRWQRLLAPARAQEVLNFWFDAPGGPDDGQLRARWFKKDEAFDAEIRGRFGAEVEAALAGGLQDWAAEPWGALARILLLDQFTRNIFRGEPRAFAGDTLALQAALSLLDHGRAQDLPPLQRCFVGLPLEHAEDLPLQQRSVAFFEGLAKEDPRLAGNADYARRHLAVIAQFGRFPHRNAILGRASSAAEQAYLAQPGAGF